MITRSRILLALLSSRLAKRLASTSEAPRVNQVGIQYLSNDLHRKVFPTVPLDKYKSPPHHSLVELLKSHLDHHGLLGKKTAISNPIKIDHFPDLVGNKSVSEHFHKIGSKDAQPYLSMAENFLSNQIPSKPDPKDWVFQLGWTRYEPGKKPQHVPYPLEDELVFDVETLYKQTHYSCLATAVSSKAWYGWVSPFLINHKKDSKFNDHQFLIPFDTKNRPKLLIGYNVSYDRARILEEYSIKQSKAFFLDAMSLHIAISGICSQQRPIWQKHKKNQEKLQEETENDEFDNSAKNDDDLYSQFSAQDLANELLDDPWLNKGSPNSLANVADFHCGIKMDKKVRDEFATLDPMDIINNFNNLMDYCAKDVDSTFSVTAKLFPEFRTKVPHPVSFAALRHMGSLMLPTTKNWNKYIETAENLYQENRSGVTNILEERVNELVKFIVDKDESLKPDLENDPWYKQLDWSIKEPRLKKNGEPFAKQAFMTGFPEWYRDLFKSLTTSEDGSKTREMKISLRTRITPLLLKLKWEGYPLVWTDSCGWCFKVPIIDDLLEDLKSKNYIEAKLDDGDFEKLHEDLFTPGNYQTLFRVPSPDGPTKRCVSIMSKSYLSFFEKEILTSEFDYAKNILKLNSNASYWMGNRSRIMDQFVIFADSKGEKNKFFDTKKEIKEHSNLGIILPKLCTMGTITRRATENTWLTASNSKKSRIGSELKAMIEAPKGYVFVGADVDSEELWIASLVGDSIFGIHGGSALGWMTLEGDKNEKTDLHSKTAELLGILRGDAKIFNYGRIYGAGVKFATRLLKQCNPQLSDDEASKLAKNLYVKTKGDLSSSKFLERKLYHGGTESIMFNMLESIAYQKEPRTPVLGASITDALAMGNLNKNNYLTSRINWAIQSSGVDYLHLLIVSMNYLIDKYKMNARLIITVHDELRYMCEEKDRYKVSLLLQISNLWTRAMFCEQLGISEVPQSCAFFSEVDIDKVLRKEVGLDCITPSHPDAILPGESLDIKKLLEVLKNNKEENFLLNGINKKLSGIRYKPGTKEVEKLNTEQNINLRTLQTKIQLSIDKNEWRQDMNEYIQMKKRLIMNGEIKDEEFAQKLRIDTKNIKVKRIKKLTPEVNLGIDGDKLLKEEIGEQAKLNTVLKARNQLRLKPQTKVAKTTELSNMSKMKPKIAPKAKLIIKLTTMKQVKPEVEPLVPISTGKLTGQPPSVSGTRMNATSKVFRGSTRYKATSSKSKETTMYSSRANSQAAKEGWKSSRYRPRMMFDNMIDRRPSNQFMNYRNNYSSTTKNTYSNTNKKDVK